LNNEGSSKNLCDDDFRGAKRKSEEEVITVMNAYNISRGKIVALNFIGHANAIYLPVNYMQVKSQEQLDKALVGNVNYFKGFE